MPETEQPNGNGAAGHDTGAAAAAFTDSMHEAEDFVKRQWRENPIGVAAVFAGVGLLIGLMLRRR
ncbi:MAG TPA: hypothetical protein VEF55_10470 [Candidatus Binatia bacterium]|nr:hypothetical protein [Candidatus Binatia bacterium]